MTYQLFIFVVCSFAIACRSPIAPVNTVTPPTPTPALASEMSPTDQVDLKPCSSSELTQRSKSDGKKAIAGGVVNQWVRCGNVPDIDVANVSDSRILVDVTFDGAGIPIRVECGDSNRPLADAAVKAAKDTRFRPVLLGGDPMNVKGVLIYKLDSEKRLRIPLKNFK